EEALPDLDEAIRLDPAGFVGSDSRLDRGYVHFCQGRWADAAEDFASQNIPFRYQLCPHQGADLVLWLYLARLLQGEEAAGLRAVKDYLHWYATGEGKRFGPLVSRFSYWPVPIARFLAGELDERQFRELPQLDLDQPGLADYEL